MMEMAVHNPHGNPLEDLPVIYGFVNGGSVGWLNALALAEDGTALGGHICSSEGFVPHDLGLVKGARPDRHSDSYAKHYPDGYRMEFVTSADVDGHERLQAVFELCRAEDEGAPVEDGAS